MTPVGNDGSYFIASLYRNNKKVVLEYVKRNRIIETQGKSVCVSEK